MSQTGIQMFGILFDFLEGAKDWATFCQMHKIVPLLFWNDEQIESNASCINNENEFQWDMRVNT
jgi:hypothetical protein